ncbi:hypothetical protein FRB90_003709 [Tulasnella sp. 427]|nr:hypothetical protein FRB90_003709 [Tulasnella sp. 427]
MPKRKPTDDAVDETNRSSSGRSTRRKLEESASLNRPESLDAEPDVAPEPEFAQVSSPEYRQKFGLNLPGADVFYQPDLVDSEVAQKWYTDLLALDTWYRPTLKVYGKSITQSRAIAAYSTTPSLNVKYSGQTVDMHYPYPEILQEIQKTVETALGVSFNYVMLNRYDDGSVYIGKHSDTLENKVIASLSLGAERTFIMSPRQGFNAEKRKWVLSDGGLLVMQGDTQRNWKHEIPKELKLAPPTRTNQAKATIPLTSKAALLPPSQNPQTYMWTHGQWQTFYHQSAQPLHAHSHSHHWDYSRHMRRGGFFRGPSRILWFTLGAVSVAWYMKGKERHAEWDRMMGERQELWNRRIQEVGQRAETTATQAADNSIDSAIASLESLRAKLEERKRNAGGQ